VTGHGRQNTIRERGSVCVVSPLPARNVARPESGVAQYVALLAGQLQADGEVRILGQKGCCVAALRLTLRLRNAGGRDCGRLATSTGDWKS